MSRTVLIVGDSHVDALKQALAQPEAEMPAWRAIRLSKIKNGKPFGDMPLDDILGIIRGLGRGDLVVCAIGGNQHQILSLIQHRRPFDLALPGEAFTPGPGHEIIPFRAMYDLFEAGFRSGDFLRIEALRSAAPCDVVQLAPPPPKADEDHILRSIETYFAEQGLQERGVTDAAIRLKVWRVQMMVLAALCGPIGVAVFPNPPETLTPEGFLAPDFYARDATHANAAYGARVIRQIEAHLAAPGARAPGA